jgi:site-specific recombinase XerD
MLLLESHLEAAMSQDYEAARHAISLPEAPTTPEAPTAAAHVPTVLRVEAEAALRFAREQHAPATRKAYSTDFTVFEIWCAERGLASLPALPATVATFLAAQARDSIKTSTLARRVAAIRYAHRLAGHETPTNHEAVKATLQGIRRSVGAAPDRKAPATAERVLAMIGFVPDTLAGRRDRALLLLGFAGAFRRSELAALTVADLEFVAEGLRVTIRRSKTDQDGEGQTVAIVRGDTACPVEAVRKWLDTAGIDDGPVFRRFSKGGRALPAALTPHSVGAIVKAYAAKAGFDAGSFGGHSLRAGFLTSAADRGASVFKMMDVSRHKSVDTLRGYVRRAEEFKNHAGDGLL